LGYCYYVCCEPLAKVGGGSAATYALTSGALNFLLSIPKTLHAERIDMDQTMSVCAWRTGDGSIRLLAAILEEGLRDVSDASCHATLVFPEGWRATMVRDIWTGEKLHVNNNPVTINLDQAQSRLLTICGKTTTDADWIQSPR
jgi:hypothetical protein